ncbi:recombination-associated protein RdgC [Methylovorus sp. MP688]|uniref:recombination-associated protein RdgC n=1 Tax=Methylovorus sp. (strain MP688) TaxID=887061 RepID=UPI0001EC4C4B|nr:recombination-associated protein RdgC [Methylovorus sp. MP688]ADQ85819.1 putative exonuclease RdgC [Methylovorus sp. MP688]
MWFKNLQIYRISQWNTPVEALEDQLARHALPDTPTSEMQQAGWIAPAGPGKPFVHVQAQQVLIALCVEKKILPNSVINQYAKARALELEEQQGYKPGRKQMKELKEAIADELRPRAFSLRRTIYAWLDLANGWFVVDAASAALADTLLEQLHKSVDGFSLRLIKTNLSPTSAMTGWLAGSEAPHGFSVDRDCELRALGDDKATVRYVRHDLEAEEIRKHIQGGKQVTRLAMTWRDRIAFVLNDVLQIKRLEALDVLKEAAADVAAEEMFDSDFVMMSGELSQLLPELLAALGGEVDTAPKSQAAAA